MSLCAHCLARATHVDDEGHTFCETCYGDETVTCKVAGCKRRVYVLEAHGVGWYRTLAADAWYCPTHLHAYTRSLETAAAKGVKP